MNMEAMILAVRGAFIYGAVFMAGLMAGGLVHSRFAFLCGLLAAGASYVAQVSEAYYQGSGAGFLHKVMLVAWAVAVASCVAGLVTLIGG